MYDKIRMTSGKVQYSLDG